MKTVLLIVLSIFLFAITLIAQPKTIHLKNPSFEDYPRAERVPKGWVDCGFEGETAADTHPSGAFDVITYPSDGHSYLGMVTRDNNTYESVGQKLEAPLVGGQCYIFKLSLCQSPTYVSASRSTGDRVNYTQPVKLVVLAGNDFCEQSEILAETEVITHEEWKTYFIYFKPSMDYSHIQLAVYYKESLESAYNGNLLIDNASPIVPMLCDSINHWSNKELDTIFKKVARKKVKITKEDIDEAIKRTPKAFPMATVTANKVRLSFMPPIYYNSTLDESEKELALKKILEVIEKNEGAKANIIIQEPTRKEQKVQRNLLVEKLKKMGVPKQKYYISLFKK